MFSWAEVWHKDFEAGSEYNFSLYYEKKKMLITFQTKEVNKNALLNLDSVSEPPERRFWRLSESTHPKTTAQGNLKRALPYPWHL